MSNLLAVLIGALIGLGGVVAGTWLQGRKEHQRWLRDQKLHAAIDFIGATGDLDQQRRRLASGGAGDMNEKAVWARVQDGRSALPLLCQASTVEAAEAVIMRVGHTRAGSDSGDDATALLRDLVGRLRAELGAGAG
jgi:hypothetical protein